MNGHSRRQSELVRRLLKRDPSSGRMLATVLDVQAFGRALAEAVDGFLPSPSTEENDDMHAALSDALDAAAQAFRKIEVDVMFHKHCARCLAATEDELDADGLCEACGKN